MQRKIGGSPKLQITFLIIGGLLALFLNLFPLPFIYSDQIFLGNSIAIALTILYGWRVGLPIAIAASLVTVIWWEHYLGVLPFSGEIIVIALAVHFRRSILLAGLLFWLTVGPIIIYGLYFYFSDFSNTEIYSIALKYSLNGLFNVLLGYLIFHIVRYSQIEPDIKFRISTTELLLNTGFFIAFGISSVTVYFWIHALNTELLGEIKKDTIVLNQVIDDSVNNHLQKHLSSIQLMSEIITVQQSNENVHSLLETTGQLYPSFITMLATNSDGDLIATFPANMLERAKQNGAANVSNRDYFTIAKKTSKVFISDSFRGVGFGSDPIIAIAVPYFIDHKFSGIIEGSLNLKNLYNMWVPSIERGAYYIIADKNGRVVFASPELNIAPLTSTTQAVPTSADIVHPGRITLLSNSREYIGYQTVNKSSNWTTLSFVPIDSYESILSGYVLRSFILLLAMSLLFGIPIYYIAKVLTRPVEKLIQNIDSANASKGIVPLELDNRGYVTELESLRIGYHKFTKNLAVTLAELTESTTLNKQLNQDLKRINDSLEERVSMRTEQLEVALSSMSATNEVKSTFMANMSHEIRTPLHGILGLTEILLHQEHSDEMRQQLLIIQDNGQHLLELLNDILDFSKIESGTLNIHNSRVEVRPYLKAITNTFAPIASAKGLKFQLNVRDSVPEYLYLDSIRTKQIVNNLISNAVKFTNAGSVKVNAFYDGRCLNIKVIDTGIGIDTDDIERIYEPFQQLESSDSKRFEGTGLGLAISMQLAKLMGGSLQCKSEVNVGTTFHFKICSSD